MASLQVYMLLFSIYEVNMWHLFRVFRELGLFHGENTTFQKKKSVALPSVKQCCPGHNFFRFQSREFFGAPRFCK
jgi:hypothetical protein